ncbi:hypothetical protein VULLAG_LOCUS19061 [Vulpes lagopus]
MLSAQGHRLGRRHRDPVRGWRGRSSEDKFSPREQPNLEAPRAAPLPPNQRQSCPPPPIRAEQWGGTKREAQARWRRAAGGGRRAVSRAARRALDVRRWF